MKRKRISRKPRGMGKLAALIAAERDIAKKGALAWHGPTAPERENPAVSLAVSFFALRKLDPKAPIFRFALRYDRNRLADFAALAMLNWQPQKFEELARAMRRTERIEFELPGRTPRERRRWLEIIQAQKHNVGIRALTRAFCYCEYGNQDKFDSERRHFTRLKKRLFPTVTPNAT